MTQPKRRGPPSKRRAPTTSVTSKDITRYYTYVDEEGDPVHRYARLGTRRWQERYEDGEWIGGKDALKDVQRVLYRLPDVIDAATNQGTVWITEGESDADKLAECNLTTTTNSGGADKWLESYTDALRGVGKVVICYDNDTRGRKHALQVERSLRRICTEADISFRRALEGKDVRDHLEANLTLDELVPDRPGPPLPVVASEGRREAYNEPRDGSHNGQIPEGERNDALARFAGKLRRVGLDEDEILPTLIAWNERCDPPIERAQLEATARSTGSYPDGHDAAVARRVEDLKVTAEARDIINAPSVGWVRPRDQTFEQYLDEEDEEYDYTIEEFHRKGGITLVDAPAKTGKTTLTCNLLKSLADDVPFLGAYPVHFEGVLAYLEFEMIPDQFREWMRLRKIKNADRLLPPWHLKGEVNPLHFEEELAEYYRDKGVTGLIIDSAAMAYSPFVENDNSSSQVSRFTEKVDRVKALANIHDLWVIAHRGATIFDEGSERPRGSTRLMDWPDALWHYSADADRQRYLRAVGRGVDVESQMLQFNPVTHELRAIGSRKSIKEDENALSVVAILLGQDQAPASSHFTKKVLTRKDDRIGYSAARKRGWIESYHDETRSAHAQFLRVTEAGMVAQTRRVEMQG